MGIMFLKQDDNSLISYFIGSCNGELADRTNNFLQRL